MELRGFAGNEPLKRTLAAMDRPPHAIIISGVKGSGRHTLAGLLEQALVCSGDGTAPCGRCPDCRRAKEGIHPDVIGLSAFVSEAELDKDVKVSAIRDLRADAQIRPNQAARKVYLIDRPMNLNAQNAMLKLLEEGPAYAAFILITENAASLLETVRSRCAQFHTAPVDRAQAVKWLTEHYPEQPRSTVFQAAEAAQGVIGRAVEILEGEEKESDTAPYRRSWVQALLDRSELELMKCAVALQTKKLTREQGERFYQGLEESLYQAVLWSVRGGKPGTEQEQQAAALSATFPRQKLLELHRLTVEAREMGKSNVSVAQSAGWLAVRLYTEIGTLP